LQVFQIWKTSETTYMLVTTSRKSFGLPRSRLDFLEVVWTSWKSGFDMQVFQIWKTSGTTYLLVTSWKSSGSCLDFLESSGRLPGSRLDFLEVVWTSWKSSGLHGSLLTKSPFHNRSECFGKFLCLIFLHLVSSCYIKFLLFFLKLKLSKPTLISLTSKHQTLYEFFSFSDLEDFSDDLPVSRLKYNALDDFQEVFQTTSISSSRVTRSRLDFLEVVWTSWKSSDKVFFYIKWSPILSL
ncbi:unnamed protein product, partial [Brassica rapa]